MKIKKLTLLNFRNYKKEEFIFNENVNVIYGKNGQGKTNVLEALYFFVTEEATEQQKKKKL